MDSLDLEIISILEENGKAKIKQMSKKLGVPPSTIHLRIKKLVERGIIKRWTIIKDWHKIGYKIKAYVLVFADNKELKILGKTQKDILEELKKKEYVEMADIITGEADLIFVARFRDVVDMEKKLLGEIQQIAGVLKTKTLVVIGNYD